MWIMDAKVIFVSVKVNINWLICAKVFDKINPFINSQILYKVFSKKLKIALTKYHKITINLR